MKATEVATIRVLNEADKDAFSLHVTGAVWIPVGSPVNHAGDRSVRGKLATVVAGRALGDLVWAANLGVLLRGAAGLAC